MIIQKEYSDFFASWIKKQIRYQKNKKGKYLHFDRPLRFVDKNNKLDQNKIAWFKNYFSNPEKNILKHPFYPFIKSDIHTPRIKHVKDSKTNKKKAVLTEKIRPIAYASHFDSLIYSFYSEQLTKNYQDKLSEWGINDCVLAYLKKDKKCNIHFAHEVFRYISFELNKTGDCVSLAFDLSSYFDNLDHLLLKKQWCKVLGVNRLPKDHFKIFNTLTNYSFIKKEYLDIRFPRPPGVNYFFNRICTPEEFRKMVEGKQTIEKNPFINTIRGSKRYGEMCGIPQGSPISACLSNIYLIEFDKLINAFAKKKGALYRRYCDDLLLICPEKEAKFFEYLISRSIRLCEVVLNEAKTEKIFFTKKDGKVRCKNDKHKRKHLQYLGFEFDGENIFIRSSSMSRYHRRLCSNAGQAIEDAYDSEFTQGEKVFRKKLYNQFTHLGKKNFVRYGIKATEIMDNSRTIKNQIKGSIEKVEKIVSVIREEKETKLKSKERPFKKMN